ncbi:MAG: alpha-E domain-containing protein [Bacteroidota bacterium]
MLSRIADALFWLNRYMERSEGMLRTIHTHYILSFDKDESNHYFWQPLLELFTQLPEDKMQTISANTQEALRYLVYDPQNVNSIKQIIGKARENARGIQDNITKEVWEHVNRLYHRMQEPMFEQELKSIDVVPLMDDLLSRSILYVGISDTTMPRGMGWSFMNLGRFTERCLLTVQLTMKEFEKIDYDLNQERDIFYWRHLLLNLSGYEHHLKTYRSANTNYNIVDQTILDKNFPRSIKYALNRMERYLKDVVQTDAYASSSVQQLYLEFSRFNSQIQFADIQYIEQHGLKNFMDMIQKNLYQFTHRLGQLFFSYT